MRTLLLFIFIHILIFASYKKNGNIIKPNGENEVTLSKTGLIQISNPSNFTLITSAQLTSKGIFLNDLNVSRMKISNHYH